jgi:hypothetical protein
VCGGGGSRCQARRSPLNCSLTSGGCAAAKAPVIMLATGGVLSTTMAQSLWLLRPALSVAWMLNAYLPSWRP